MAVGLEHSILAAAPKEEEAVVAPPVPVEMQAVLPQAELVLVVVPVVQAVAEGLTLVAMPFIQTAAAAEEVGVPPVAGTRCMAAGVERVVVAALVDTQLTVVPAVPSMSRVRPPVAVAEAALMALAANAESGQPVDL